MYIEIRMRPSVCEVSGNFFRVVLMNKAFRSEKSHCDWEHISSCLPFRAMA
jgi:hypothetical protein